MMKNQENHLTVDADLLRRLLRDAASDLVEIRRDIFHEKKKLQNLEAEEAATERLIQELKEALEQ